MSFEAILGKDASVFTDEERRHRWREWQECSKSKHHQWVVEYWSGHEGCGRCVHLDKQNSWCTLQGLPCSVNPILSFKYGMLGMACMGAGKEEPPMKPIQYELF